MKELKALDILKKAEWHITSHLIEKNIFEEAIKELEELNNRSCDSCKYYKPQYYECKEDILDQWIYCDEIYAETRDLTNLKNFYCSRYEVKGE